MPIITVCQEYLEMYFHINAGLKLESELFTGETSKWKSFTSNRKNLLSLIFSWIENKFTLEIFLYAEPFDQMRQGLRIKRRFFLPIGLNTHPR